MPPTRDHPTARTPPPVNRAGSSSSPNEEYGVTAVDHTPQNRQIPGTPSPAADVDPSGANPSGELLEWLVLRRVLGSYLDELDEGPVPDTLTAALVEAGWLALADPDPAAEPTPPVLITDAGLARYAQLAKHYLWRSASPQQPDDNDDSRPMGYVMTGGCPHPVPGGPAWHVGPCHACGEEPT